MSNRKIVETIHQNRQYKNCLCCVCGEISKCTPTNDFYQTDDHGEGIVCERCFGEYTGHKLNVDKWVVSLNDSTI